VVPIRFILGEKIIDDLSVASYDIETKSKAKYYFATLQVSKAESKILDLNQ
jgi:hypothetical protein